MTDTDIHSCGYYCDRPLCIKAQRNELRNKLFSEQAVKTYSGGKPNYTQPDIPNNLPIEWVNLTAAEVKILRNASNNDREFAALVIARFKEKNNGCS